MGASSAGLRKWMIIYIICRPEKPTSVMDLDVTTNAYWDLLPFKEEGLRFSHGHDLDEKQAGRHQRGVERMSQNNV